MWDLFCSVIDNYGDAGVSWRLARVLRDDHGIRVRLWIDDLATLARLAPQIDPQRPLQQIEGIEVRAWTAPFAEPLPGDVVIEAFGCRLPETFLHAMAARNPQPVWLNLEYLSAEAWVRGCHLAPSQHPRLPLRKTFFFPGFDAQTGGLLRERGLSDARRAFQANRAAQAAFWAQWQLEAPAGDERRVSLFCYDNPALPVLLESWCAGTQPTTVLMPDGPALPRIAAFFGRNVHPGDCVERGALRLQVLPFSDQARYDRLLWACDLNFVRGEDSFVRAQWAARPLVWHIYPQEEAAHLVKLRAFLDLYGAGLSEAARPALWQLHAAWNGAPDAQDMAVAWAAWARHEAVMRAHAQAWAQMRESGPELATELVKFVQGQVK